MFKANPTTRVLHRLPPLKDILPQLLPGEEENLRGQREVFLHLAKHFVRHFLTTDGRPGRDLVKVQADDQELSKMVKAFLNEFGNIYWPSETDSPCYGRLQYTKPTHAQRIEKQLTALFCRINVSQRDGKYPRTRTRKTHKSTSQNNSNVVHDEDADTESSANDAETEFPIVPQLDNNAGATNNLEPELNIDDGSTYSAEPGLDDDVGATYGSEPGLDDDVGATYGAEPEFDIDVGVVNSPTISVPVRAPTRLSTATERTANESTTPRGEYDKRRMTGTLQGHGAPAPSEPHPERLSHNLQRDVACESLKSITHAPSLESTLQDLQVSFLCTVTKQGVNTQTTLAASVFGKSLLELYRELDINSQAIRLRLIIPESREVEIQIAPEDDTGFQQAKARLLLETKRVCTRRKKVDVEFEVEVLGGSA